MLSNPGGVTNVLLFLLRDALSSKNKLFLQKLITLLKVLLLDMFSSGLSYHSTSVLSPALSLWVSYGVGRFGSPGYKLGVLLQLDDKMLD